MNTMVGSRDTVATVADPVSGRSSLRRVDHWSCGNASGSLAVALNPLVNLLTNEVSKIGLRMNSLTGHAKFIDQGTDSDGSGVLRSLCCNKIITSGILGKTLSFANSSHTDKKDKLCPSLQEECAQTLRGCDMGSSTCWASLDDGERGYLTSWKKRFGSFDSPTTCGYAACGGLEVGAVVYQFFKMSGMRLTVRIGPGVAHSFFARQFCHNTAVVVGVHCNGRVFLKHDSHCCFAWGLGNPAEK